MFERGKGNSICEGKGSAPPRRRIHKQATPQRSPETLQNILLVVLRRREKKGRVYGPGSLRVRRVPLPFVGRKGGPDRVARESGRVCRNGERKKRRRCWLPIGRKKKKREGSGFPNRQGTPGRRGERLCASRASEDRKKGKRARQNWSSTGRRE